MTLTASY